MFDLKSGFIVSVVLACSVLISDAVEFQIYNLAQSWPQTSCWDLNNLWAEAATAECSKCQMPKDKQSFTIHGLWPSNKNKRSPENCGTEQLNAQSLNSQKAVLNQKWPSFNMKKSNVNFWGYEWMKHGTCSPFSVPEYFGKSVELLDKNNAGQVLASAGIVSGNKYPYSQVVKALEDRLKVNVRIKCATNSATQEEYINEVNICYDKSFQLTNCKNSGSTTNCKNPTLQYPANLKTCPQ